MTLYVSVYILGGLPFHAVLISMYLELIQSLDIVKMSRLNIIKGLVYPKNYFVINECVYICILILLPDNLTACKVIHSLYALNSAVLSGESHKLLCTKIFTPISLCMSTSKLV